MPALECEPRGHKRPKSDPTVLASDSSSQSGEDDLPEEPTGLSADLCFVCNKSSGIAHLAEIRELPGTRVLSWEIDGVQKFLRPRCGAQTVLKSDCYLVAGDIPAEFEPGRRLGCRASGP